MSYAKLILMLSKYLPDFVEMIKKQGVPFVLLCAFAWLMYQQNERQHKENQSQFEELKQCYSEIQQIQKEQLQKMTIVLERNNLLIEQVLRK